MPCSILSIEKGKMERMHTKSNEANLIHIACVQEYRWGIIIVEEKIGWERQAMAIKTISEGESFHDAFRLNFCDG